DPIRFAIGWQAQLGGLALAAGRTEQAIRILEGASRSPTERTHAKYLLGKAYEEFGNPTRALDAYRAFLSRTADGDQDLPAIVNAKAAVARLDAN
ncbi:MAG: tetratricopeptide repeat protein, partial [Gemmatimonadetes bacterium]|nr:tetratricopeptide repeat protein [Gemmatimonadota bacterium]NNL29443.1 tetratricopeptide repeat protein [Gemmatimonadota bacterium]